MEALNVVSLSTPSMPDCCGIKALMAVRLDKRGLPDTLGWPSERLGYKAARHGHRPGGCHGALSPGTCADGATCPAHRQAKYTRHALLRILCLVRGRSAVRVGAHCHCPTAGGGDRQSCPGFCMPRVAKLAGREMQTCQLSL